ncbi:MAG: hypothetical protein ACI8UR_001843 [Natronomonas sp.]|jgi:hypothetical protein|uniref:luciferase domain-containing protein n=1 Tax=Natronomonas sp. TaxID=2184060 RepID=UPI0039898942
MRDDISNGIDGGLPRRQGSPPETTDTNPHSQLTQNPDQRTYEALADQLFTLPDASERPSRISVPGARALVLDENIDPGPQEAFMTGREFCHLHPPTDGSLHMALPTDVADTAVQRGWAEPHPMAERGVVPATVVMVYAPRDADERAVVFALVRESYRYAGGRE